MFKRIHNRDESGFTLIELLMVVGIIGVLAAVAIFAVGGIGDDSQAAACSADEQVIATAQEAYFAENRVFAASVAALVTANYLREASTLHSTDNTGATTPIGACV